MRIELITPQEHKNLIEIQKDFPVLTFQNNGYEHPDFINLTEQERAKFNEVTELLKKHVEGFVKFNHFRINRKNEIEIRLQYNYGYDGGQYFIGVGYLTIDNLLNGFDN